MAPDNLILLWALGFSALLSTRELDACLPAAEEDLIAVGASEEHISADPWALIKSAKSE